MDLNQTLRGGSLKDFQVMNKLGEGSFSQVFKVKRHDDGKEYAMKKVKMQLLKDKEKENALNEVRILASLSDDYIVGYKEAFIDNNELHVIMEYCPKGDIMKFVNEYIKSKILIDEKEIWKAILHMLKGLKCLHEMDILHRDLKCANVFINVDGIYKLGDLNVSKIAKRGLVYTQTGTPYYAAPEVWKDKPYDSKCDIWSLGCVAYEMCALKPPFRAVDMEGLYKKIQKGIFDKIPPKYSIDLFTIIQSCLKVNPSQRPSATELLNHPLLLKNIGDETSSLQLKQIQNKQNLLQTIKCPRNLFQLKGKLPKAQYNKQNDKINDKILNNNKSFIDIIPEQITQPATRKEQVCQQKIQEEPKNIPRKNRILSAGPSRHIQDNSNNYHYKQQNIQDKDIISIKPPLINKLENNAIVHKIIEPKMDDYPILKPVVINNCPKSKPPRSYAPQRNYHENNHRVCQHPANENDIINYQIVQNNINKSPIIQRQRVLSNANNYEYLYQRNQRYYNELEELRNIYQSHDNKNAIQPKRYQSRPYSAKDSPSKLVQENIVKNQDLYNHLAQKEKQILGQYKQYDDDILQNGRIQRNQSEKSRINNKYYVNNQNNIRQSYDYDYKQRYDPNNYIYQANYYGNGNKHIKRIL